MADTLEVDERSSSLRSSISDLWTSPRVGPLLKLLLAYLVIIEVGVQVVFGRFTLFGLDIGLQDHTVPHAIFLNGASIGLLYGLLGMGLILVYRANRIINFAQAQLGSVPAVTALLLMGRQGVNYFLVVPIVIVGALVLGAVVEVAFIRRLRNAPRLIVTVATIGVSILLVALELLVQQWITGALITSSSFTAPWNSLHFDIASLRCDGNFIVMPLVTVSICVALGAFFK